MYSPKSFTTSSHLPSHQHRRSLNSLTLAEMVVLTINSRREFNCDHKDLWNVFLTTGRLMPTLQDLHQAIRSRDVPKVQALAACASIKLNSSIRSCTALSLAVYQGDQYIVQILLENGAAVDKLSRDWNHRIETPLFSSCRLGQTEIAKLLLFCGADVNSTDFYNHSPLWIATRERNYDLVKLLVEHEALLNTPDKWSQCPLYMATKYYGREKIAVTLIQHGCKLDISDLEGNGAFYWSLVNGLETVVKLLVRAGVHISKKDRDLITGRNPTNIMQEKPELAAWLHNELKTPPPLKLCAAQAVRNGLSAASKGKSIWSFVDKLPVPTGIRIELKLVMQVDNADD